MEHTAHQQCLSSPPTQDSDSADSILGELVYPSPSSASSPPSEFAPDSTFNQQGYLSPHHVSVQNVESYSVPDYEHYDTFVHPSSALSGPHQDFTQTAPQPVPNLGSQSIDAFFHPQQWFGSSHIASRSPQAEVAHPSPTYNSVSADADAHTFDSLASALFSANKLPVSVASTQRPQLSIVVPGSSECAQHNFHQPQTTVDWSPLDSPSSFVPNWAYAAPPLSAMESESYCDPYNSATSSAPMSATYPAPSGSSDATFALSPRSTDVPASSEPELFMPTPQRRSPPKFLSMSDDTPTQPPPLSLSQTSHLMDISHDHTSSNPNSVAAPDQTLLDDCTVSQNNGSDSPSGTSPISNPGPTIFGFSHAVSRTGLSSPPSLSQVSQASTSAADIGSSSDPLDQPFVFPSSQDTQASSSCTSDQPFIFPSSQASSDSFYTSSQSGTGSPAVPSYSEVQAQAQASTYTDSDSHVMPDSSGIHSRRPSIDVASVPSLALPVPGPSRISDMSLTAMDLISRKRRGMVKKPPKMHQCYFCKKTFPRPSGRDTHMNTHTGAKPFECPVDGCDKSFAVRSNAKRHLRTHGLPDFPESTPIPRKSCKTDAFSALFRSKSKSISGSPGLSMDDEDDIASPGATETASSPPTIESSPLKTRKLTLTTPLTIRTGSSSPLPMISRMATSTSTSDSKHDLPAFKSDQDPGSPSAASNFPPLSQWPSPFGVVKNVRDASEHFGRLFGTSRSTRTRSVGTLLGRTSASTRLRSRSRSDDLKASLSGVSNGANDQLEGPVDGMLTVTATATAWIPKSLAGWSNAEWLRTGGQYAEEMTREEFGTYCGMGEYDWSVGFGMRVVRDGEDEESVSEEESEEESVPRGMEVDRDRDQDFAVNCSYHPTQWKGHMPGPLPALWAYN